jgi:hypothetical protein
MGDRLDDRHLGWRLDPCDWFLIFMNFAISVMMCRPTTPCVFGRQTETRHRSVLLDNRFDGREVPEQLSHRNVICLRDSFEYFVDALIDTLLNLLFDETSNLFHCLTRATPP